MSTNNPPPADPQAVPAPMLQGPKRQHYLPQFYLEGFTAEDGCLAVFDRSTSGIRRQKPVNTAVVGHMYTVTDGEGRQRFELEAGLSQIESLAAVHIRDLIATGRLTNEARTSISHFIGLLAVRTPEFIEGIRKFSGSMIKDVTQRTFTCPASLAERLRADPEHAGKDNIEIERLAADIVEFAQAGDFDIKTNSEWAVTMALPLGEVIAPLLFDRNWTLVTAEHRSAFVTSDAPVALTSVMPAGTRGIYGGTGFGSPDALVFAPLSSTHAIAIFGAGQNFHRTTADSIKVRSINRGIAKSCQRFLLGRHDKLVSSVATDTNLATTKWKPKFSVNGHSGNTP